MIVNLIEIDATAEAAGKVIRSTRRMTVRPCGEGDRDAPDGPIAVLARYDDAGGWVDLHEADEGGEAPGLKVMVIAAAEERALQALLPRVGRYVRRGELPPPPVAVAVTLRQLTAIGDYVDRAVVALLCGGAE